MSALENIVKWINESLHHHALFLAVNQNEADSIYLAIEYEILNSGIGTYGDDSERKKWFPLGGTAVVRVLSKDTDISIRSETHPVYISSFAVLSPECNNLVSQRHKCPILVFYYDDASVPKFTPKGPA